MKWYNSKKLLTVFLAVSVFTSFIPGYQEQHAHAANPQLTVDLATIVKPNVDHAASGALYGLRFDRVPNDRALAPLRMKMLAQPPANPGMLPNGEVRPFGDAVKVSEQAIRNGIEQIQIYMPDVYPNFPQKWISWDDYLSKVDSIVDSVQKANKPNLFTYIPWNEPDWTWDSAKAGNYLEGYKRIYDRIRSKDLITLTEGPNIAAYNHTFMMNFLTYCKANNCLPDIISYHELEDNSYTDIQTHVDDVRAIENSLGISHRPISINEYGRPSDVGIPGYLVQLMAKFERAGVDSAALPFWFQGGTLGDLLINPNSVPNGAYWLYKFYGDMTGSMVKTTTPFANGLDGMASRDDRNKRSIVVVGGGTGNNDVVIKGFGATPYLSDKVHIQIWKTSYTGSRTSKLTTPQYLSDGEYSIVNGQVTVTLNNMVDTEAYQLIVSPSTPTASYTANRFEAEYAQLDGSAKVMRDHTGYGGTGFVAGYDGSNTANSRFVVSVDHDGMYTANLRYSAGPLGGGTANRVVGLYVNGTKWKDTVLGATASWDQWATKQEKLFLLEGVNTIEYRAETNDNNDTINLDCLDIAESTATVIQAENAQLAGSAKIATDHMGYNGTGFVAGYDSSTNASTTFTVNVPTAGTYYAALRYSAGEQYLQGWADNRTVGLYVNGVKIKDIHLLGTVTWDIWMEDIQEVALNAGTNTISFKAELANNDDSINLDQITLFTK